MHGSAFAFVLLVAIPAAAEVRGGDTASVAAGETIDGNLYISGGTITVRGDVLGDVVAAGGTVIVDGHVFGDVLAVGGELQVGGVVDGDVRAAGGEVRLRGPTRGDAVAAGGDVEITGRVGGDAFVGAGTSRIAGPIAGALAIGAGEARIASAVGRDARVNAGRLHLDPGTMIGGNLLFTGDDLERSTGVVVAGSITERAREGAGFGMMFVAWLQLLVGICLFGILWLALFRNFAERATSVLAARPGLCLGIGAAVFFIAPIVFTVALAVGVLIGGWWISLIGAAIYATAIAIAFPLFALFLGRRLLARRLGETPSLGREIGAMVLFLVVLAIIAVIPIVGALVTLAVILLGLGAIAVTLVSTLRRTSAPADATVPPRTRADTAGPSMPPTPSPA